jgi:hypothetical protein
VKAGSSSTPLLAQTQSPPGKMQIRASRLSRRTSRDALVHPWTRDLAYPHDTAATPDAQSDADIAEVEPNRLANTNKAKKPCFPGVPQWAILGSNQ